MEEFLSSQLRLDSRLELRVYELVNKLVPIIIKVDFAIQQAKSKIKKEYEQYKAACIRLHENPYDEECKRIVQNYTYARIEQDEEVKNLIGTLLIE